MLREVNLIPQVGDIILYFNNFYEIDGNIENQFILGKDPDYSMATETTDHGDSFSISVNGYLSRVEKLNLIPLRGGKYPSLTKLYGGVANQAWWTQGISVWKIRNEETTPEPDTTNTSLFTVQSG